MGNEEDLKRLALNVPCQGACPIMTDVGGYIEALVREDYEKAYEINRIDNVLPGVLGRVCHRPCEDACRHGREGRGDPIEICFLKRSATDFGLKPYQPKVASNGKTVCIVGSGPAGLTAANDLALRGYTVTLLEQCDTPGGMLRHSIPTFRLPVEVVEKDIQSILDLGVTLQTGVRIDSYQHLQDLQHKYDAVIFSVGCMLSTRLELEGETDVEGFFWGLDFMVQAASKQLSIEPERAVIIGGSYVAVDCARTCFRRGAREVTMAYRRTKEYLRAGTMEMEALDEEGIQLEFMTSPVAIESKDGKVTGVRMVRNELDEQGLARPVRGSEFVVEADTVILAIGQEVESYEFDLAGDVQKLFFAAGDCKNGSGTVVEACADGRAVALKVHEALSGICVEPTVTSNEVQLDEIPRNVSSDGRPAEEMKVLPLKKRRPGNAEVELGFDKKRAKAEAERCYLCQYEFKIDPDYCIYCELCIEFSPVDCIRMVKKAADGALTQTTTNPLDAESILIDTDACIRCGECVRVCPTSCISITRHACQLAAHSS